MAIAFRASAEAHVSTGSTTVTIPGTVQAGDCLIIFAGMNNGGNAAVDWSTPAGWTRADDRSVGSNLYAAVYVRVAQAGDASSTVTLSSANTGKSCAILAAYSGTDTVTPVNVIGATSESTSTASHVTPSVVTSADQAWVIAACVQSNSVTESWTTASGYTKRQDSLDNASPSGHVTGTVQDQGPEAVGTYGSATLTALGASSKAAMWTIGLAPVSSTQVSRPTSDVASSGAVGVPTPGGGSGIYADLAANDDTHYAEISDAGYVEVGFAALVDPVSSSGHTIRYRAEFAGGAAAGTLTVTLKEGSTTRATWTDTLAGSFGAFSHTLTSTEANAITDYSVLRVRFAVALT